ncbi:MAG: PGF-pre-PGF domain-containing protein [Candidatus Nanoarchaeia archaeon]
MKPYYNNYNTNAKIIFVSLGIILAFVIVFVANPSIIGKFFEGGQKFAQEINEDFTISGVISEDVKAKVYLKTDNNMFLGFNAKDLVQKTKSRDFASGFLTEVGEKENKEKSVEPASPSLSDGNTQEGVPGSDTTTPEGDAGAELYSNETQETNAEENQIQEVETNETQNLSSEEEIILVENLTNVTNVTNETVFFATDIEDANNNKIEAIIEFINAETEEIEAISKSEKGEKSVEEVFTAPVFHGAAIVEEKTGKAGLNILKGKYKIKVKPQNIPIKEIVFTDININQNVTAFIKLDDVPETENYERYTEIYAIDPTALNFTEATVTVTAKGSELWKCKDWDFEARRCNGKWIYLMNILPGENYSFILTPEDPAYAELSPQYIIECTEGGVPGTCTFSYLATDDTQYEQFRVDKGAVINRLNVSVNSTSVPTNAMITNATVCILAYRDSTLGDDAGDACGIYAGENATGTPTYTTAVSKTQATCQLWTTSVGNPNAVCGEITSWLNSKADPIASARKLIIVFDGTEQADNNVDLWIDYMYVNITYILKPNVTLVSPSNGSVTTSNTVNFTCNATNDLQLSNITFYWNYTGTWQSNGTISASGTSNQTTFQRTNLSNGAILWNCYACDNESACAFAPSNWTVTVNYTALDTPPTVTLSYPPDNYYNDTSQYVDLTFNASVTDDYALVNCSLWHNYTGTWHNNQTQTVTGTSNVTNFTLNDLTNKTFIWNIECYDNASQSAFAAANRTVILNWTPPNQAPQITLNQPANNTQFNDTQDINFNFTAIDDQNTTLSCSIYLDDNLNQTNNSVQNNTLTNFLIQGIGYGSHNWSINCTDGELNNISETRFFSIADTIAPFITINSPLNQSYNNTTILLNISATDTNLDEIWYNWNGTNYTYAAPIYITFNEGVNILYAYANDTFGNLNSTFVTFTTDTTAPTVTFVNPTPGNNTNITIDYTTINITAVDTITAIHTCILDWNGTNYTMTKVGTGLSVVCTRNITGLTEGNYTYQAYANDSLGNTGASGARNLQVIAPPDTTPPTISLISPINGTIDTDGELLFEYNVTDSASAVANCSLILNGTINETDTSIIEGITQSFAKVLANGYYNWSINCTDNSSNANVGSSDTWVFTVNITAAPPTPPTKGPRGGGVTPEPTAGPSFIFSLPIEPGTTELYIPNKISIINITVTTKTVLPENVKVRIYELTDGPSSAPPLSNIVYKYWQIITENMPQNISIDKIEIKFKVSKRWVEEKNIDINTLRLNRYTNIWNELPTKLIAEDLNNYYFIGESHMLSLM